MVNESLKLIFTSALCIIPIVVIAIKASRGTLFTETSEDDDSDKNDEDSSGEDAETSKDIRSDKTVKKYDDKDRRLSDKKIRTVLGHHLVIRNSVMDNNNIFVCGSSGSGKSSRFVIPNIMSKECSYIVADPGGNLYRDTSGYMRSSHGGKKYDVKALNLLDPYHSLHYNPICYIRDEADVRYFAQTLSKASKGSSGRQRTHGGDPFWDQTANLMLQGLVFMMYDILPESERTLSGIGHLAEYFQRRDGYDGDDYNSPGGVLLNEIESVNPHAKSVDMLHKILTAADKTLSSIIISLLADFNNLCTDEIMELTRKDEMHLETISERPTILYVIYDETDSTKNVISDMLYMQCLRLLYHKVQKKALKYPVRFIIDDFSNTDIPDFELYIRTCRKYQISLCPIVQSPGQLLEKYPEATARDIMSNCSVHLFTGSYDLNELDSSAKLFHVDRAELERLQRFEFYAAINGKVKKIRGIIPEKQKYAGMAEKRDVSRDFIYEPQYKKQAYDIGYIPEYMRPFEKKDEEGAVHEMAASDMDMNVADRRKKLKLRNAVYRLRDDRYRVRSARRYMSASERIYADIIRKELKESGLSDKVTVSTQQSLATLFEFHSESSDFPPYENTAEMSCDIVLIKNDDSSFMDILAGFEIDGPSHEEPIQQELDKYKDAVFKTARVPLIRLPLHEDRDELVKRIKDCIKEIKRTYFRKRERIAKDKLQKHDIAKHEEDLPKSISAEIRDEPPDELEFDDLKEDDLTEDMQLTDELEKACDTNGSPSPLSVGNS